MSTDTDDVPDIDMDRLLRVTFGKELRYAPTLTELIRCRRHQDGTLQPVPLPKVGPNTPYPSSPKGTHRRVHRHYQCKDLTSTVVWAAAYREDPRTKYIYEILVRSPTLRHQLQDAKLSVDDGKFFLSSTMGKRVPVPRMLVSSIVAMYHESRHMQQMPGEWSPAFPTRGVKHARKPHDFLLQPPGRGPRFSDPATHLQQGTGRRHARTRPLASPSSPASRIHKGPGKGPGQIRETRGRADNHKNVNKPPARVLPSRASIRRKVHCRDQRAPPLGS